MYRVVISSYVAETKYLEEVPIVRSQTAFIYAINSRIGWQIPVRPKHF